MRVNNILKPMGFNIDPVSFSWVVEESCGSKKQEYARVVVKKGKDKVNQLYSNALWSQKDNFLDVPTDCPQRDERLGWTGDAQIFSATACYNMYMPSFYRKYLGDMRAEQGVLGGAVPNVVPRLKEGMVAKNTDSFCHDDRIWLNERYGNH